MMRGSIMPMAMARNTWMKPTVKELMDPRTYLHRLKDRVRTSTSATPDSSGWPERLLTRI